MTRSARHRHRHLWTFGAGLLAGAAGAVIVRSLSEPHGLDPRLVRRLVRNAEIPPTVIVPGVLGSSLDRPDGSRAWVDLGNVIGWHDLGLDLAAPTDAARDGLEPSSIVGVEPSLPRLFGFTEYSDLVGLLEAAGFRYAGAVDAARFLYLYSPYDWRLDLRHGAQRLHATLETLAARSGNPAARFNVIAHSMGGLVARYYLRYGTADVGGPVTWAGARRIGRLLLGATPNAGSIDSLDAILNGERVGLSYGTLSAKVIARLPAIYNLLPPRETKPLVDESGRALAVDLHDSTVWQERGWGPFAPPRNGDRAAEHSRAAAFATAALKRARQVHEALTCAPETPCPTPVAVLGADCLPTRARAVLPASPGSLPRFEPKDATEAEAIMEAGDGTVTRASVLATHLPGARTHPLGSGIAEVQEIFFGAADHHGLYGEPALQHRLLRFLLR
jgi:hypothetical protein